MTTDEAAYAVQSTVDSQCEEAMQCGQWVGSIVQDIIIRRLLTLCLRHTGISQMKVHYSLEHCQR